jgi:protein CpxP
MKKISLMLVSFLSLAAVVNAQGGGGFQRRTPEERTASIHSRIDSAFKLEPNKMANLDTALVTLYRQQDKKREELMAGGMPDRETMMAEMKKFSDAQDEIMKAVLTADQFTIWKEKIQPSMRPQRQPGSGGNR